MCACVRLSMRVCVCISFPRNFFPPTLPSPPLQSSIICTTQGHVMNLNNFANSCTSLCRSKLPTKRSLNSRQNCKKVTSTATASEQTLAELKDGREELMTQCAALSNVHNTTVAKHAATLEDLLQTSGRLIRGKSKIKVKSVCG